MMEFRFDVSAGELKIPLEKETIEEVVEQGLPIVSLAPFTSNTKISFENVIVGRESTQKVIVQNPGSAPLKVNVKSVPPSERCVTVTWEDCTIPANDSVLFEITWSPIEVGAWRHTITFQFGKCSKKDLPIAFNCIPSKKILKKQINMEKKPDKPKLVPKSIMKSRIPSEKENVIPHKKSIPKIQFSCDNTFNITSSTPNVRRETYIVKEGFLPHIKEDIHDISNDSLEITSPRKNNHFSSPLKNLNNFYSKSDNCILDTCKLYPHSQSEVDLHYISSETYTKANISTSTYVKGNLSTISPETPAKDDLNSNTYVKHEPQDLPSKNITWSARKSSSFMSNVSHIDYDINLSPIWNNSNVHQKNMSGVKVKEVIEANMWGETKEKINDCSPSKDLFRYRKRKSNDMFDTSPAKRAFLEEDASTHSSRKLDWNKTKTMSKKFYSGASYLNPFLLESTYHDEEWMEKQENIFKNWLNALLTPPVELDTKENDRPINVAKLWQQCKQNSVPLAPSKENVSNNYHVNHRLEALRKSARSLFRSNEVAEVLAKITSNIENQKLSIRTDKNVHLDLGLQSEIMTLLLSYNPLWLRIGLETIYNTGLLLTSNSDIMGISNFLMQNLFKDSFLLRKHKTIHSPKYASDIKKFILKKFLTIVYFLDFAKCKVLISHDPCLFRRNALVKESRELILSFSRELLSSVGDVTRLLRFMGYTVNHKQTYIQEFNYAVVHLGVDLRDGVRLTKVMEVILLRKDLTERLRVPAVSRLQKIHNMSLVFDALAEANFAIIGDISPRDIVDGHHEKCLSFLWQIIYKFQAPLMANSAMKIQKWWRSLPIVLKRRRKARRILSAVKIQKWYRRHLLAIKLIKIIPVIQDMLTQRMLTHSAITIQSTFRMYVQKKKYGQIKHSVIMIQSLVRGNLLRKCVRQKLHSIVTIQAYARMYIDRKKYLRIRASVIYLQQMYRAKQLMLKEMAKFQKLKASVLLVQQRYRSNKSTQIERQRYLTVKSAVITLQVHFRAFISMKSERTKYLQIKCACITIQRYFRSYQKMKKNAKNYSDLRQAVVIVQRRYRANQLAKTDRLNYNRLKSAAILIQRRFRAKKQMQLDYSNYQSLKKAALVLQRRYRAKRLGKTECERYNVLKKSVVTIQRRFRANKSMRAQRHWYQQLRAATIIIQRQFRAKKERETFNALQNSVIIVQRRFRANKAMKAQRQIYLELRSVTINVQRRFRAQLLMHIEVSKFSDRKKAAIAIQSKYRATVMMRNERTKYEALKKAAVTIQTRFRANQIMKLERSKYVQLQKSTIVIQRRFRAYKLMQSDSVRYKTLKETAAIIQRRFRANKAMQVQRTNYENLKKAALLIQRRYRAKRLGKKECERYNVLKKTVVTIQRRFRENNAMKTQRRLFLQLRTATIVIQRRFRAKRLMRNEMSKLSELKQSVVIIQRKFRATLMMRLERAKYETLKKSVVTIQIRFRANRLMKLERSKYTRLQKAVIVVQQRFRANKLMQADLVRYKQLKEVTISIQRRFRANKLMKMEYTNYQRLRRTIVFIQQAFRTRMANNMVKIDTAVITIQRRFRAFQQMKIEHIKYYQMKRAAIIIQRRWRRFVNENEGYKLKRLQNAAATKLQACWKGYKVRKAHPNIRRIRNNVKDLTANSFPQNTLQNRRESAIKILRDAPTLHQILLALEDLDYITRRCQNTLRSMSESLPAQLYLFVKSANRSPAEMELSTIAVSILINFYKYEPTSASAWVPSRIDHLIIVMSHCCDKEEKLFPYLCTLIWLFAHNSDYKKFICSLPTFSNLFKTIKNLCLRKQKMVARKNPIIASYFRSVSHPPQPLLTPDWGLDYKNRPRTFMNSIHALNSVLKILDYD